MSAPGKVRRLEGWSAEVSIPGDGQTVRVYPGAVRRESAAGPPYVPACVETAVVLFCELPHPAILAPGAARTLATALQQAADAIDAAAGPRRVFPSSSSFGGDS